MARANNYGHPHVGISSGSNLTIWLVGLIGAAATLAGAVLQTADKSSTAPPSTVEVRVIPSQTNNNSSLPLEESTTQTQPVDGSGAPSNSKLSSSTKPKTRPSGVQSGVTSPNGECTAQDIRLRRCDQTGAEASKKHQ